MLLCGLNLSKYRQSSGSRSLAPGLKEPVHGMIASILAGVVNTQYFSLAGPGQHVEPIYLPGLPLPSPRPKENRIGLALNTAGTPDKDRVWLISFAHFQASTSSRAVKKPGFKRPAFVISSDDWYRTYFEAFRGCFLISIKDHFIEKIFCYCKINISSRKLHRVKVECTVLDSA